MSKTNLVLTSAYVTREKLAVYDKLYGFLPDPDKILTENGDDYGILRDVMNDPHVMACVEQRKMQVMQMGCEIEYAGEATIKKEVQNILDSIDVTRVISNVLDALFYGFAVQEIRWAKRNNKYFPIEVMDKPQDYFYFDNDNTIRLKRYKNGVYSGMDGEKLPDYKFLLTQNKPTFDNPYGEKLLSRCYWNVSFKRAVIEYWQLLTERYGVPFLIGRYPSTATEEEKLALMDQLNDMIENNVAVMKEGSPVEFLTNPKNDVGGLFDHLIAFHNREISKAILTVTATIETQQYGNYKAADIHKDMLEYLGIADKKLVEKALNKVMEFYIALNYGNADVPRIKMVKKESVIEESSERDLQLTQMGVRFTRDYLMKRYNLQEKDFEIDSEKTSKDVYKSKE